MDANKTLKILEGRKSLEKPGDGCHDFENNLQRSQDGGRPPSLGRVCLVMLIDIIRGTQLKGNSEITRGIVAGDFPSVQLSRHGLI